MADKIKGDLFLARALTRTHKSPAVNPATFSDSDSIYSSSFSHHVITKPSAFRYAHVHAPTPERITQIFHDKFYASKIQRYIEGDHPLSRDDFFKIITEDPTNANTTADNRVGPNLISVLIGRIGIGKSTLISNLMIQYRRAIHNANLIPVVVDVENLAGPAADKNEFYRLLYIRLYESVVDSEVLSKRDAESLLARCNPSIDSKDRDLQAQLYALATKAFLVELFHETGHRVLLFLDNVDKYYYLFDRGGFSEEGDLKRQASMQKLEGIIAEFESPNGVIDGAGLNVLVCMRRYTLEYLIATGSVVPGKRLNLREDGSHIFRLAPCSADQVIESRVRLLQEALRIPNGPVLASSIEGRIRAANRIWDSLKKARERAEIRMLDDLSHLGNHGHRSLIDYFSGYKWVLNDSVLMHRFFETYSPAILLYMLKGNTRYSQVECKFPNLFLVRGDIETAAESTVPRSLIAPHKHTYWLKFLLARYISFRKDHNIAVNTRDILDVFSPDAEGNRCYETHITELILGSLSQVDVSAMIEPAFSTSLDGQKLAIRDILMTMRGSLLIKRFAFDFTYLQLVVEDYMLEFPAYLVNDFAFQPKVNYGYLLQKHDDYQQRAIEMINFKCDQVFLFLMILEVTHAVEVERRSITFERLATRGVARLNFEQIRGNLRSAILNIGKALHSDGIEARVKNAIDVAERSRRRLDEFFRDAYLLHQV